MARSSSRSTPATPAAADSFAAIAARSPAGAVAELITPAPPAPPKRLLPAARHDSAAAFTPPRRAASAPELSRDLAHARRRWAPFLRNFAPAPANARIVVPLPSADWRLEPAADWQRVSIPHYGGPIGRARAWYRFNFTVTPAMRAVGGLFACFRGVDYQAAVFCNGHLVGTHEGFFAAFNCDLTATARDGENELLVRVDNDAICMGNGFFGRADQQGDKIYAATGLGWDEPGLGWHHCPPGMGICQPVTIEARPLLHVHDLWVRPLPAEGRIVLHAEVWNGTGADQPLRLGYALHARNFRKPAASRLPAGDFGPLAPAGPGINFYQVSIALPEARIWSPDTPWLYQSTVTLRPPATDAAKAKAPALDALARPFGQRSFTMDTTSVPRGRLFLNGRSLRLRGANTMGHEQQCVFKGDHAQLLDDLLLVKLGNLNFLRFTQRPVEREVYELCDALGILSQSDLPLFAYLRRNQFSEAVRQAAEMERHVRSHPSAIIASFINEPFPDAWCDKSHRHLRRLQLEAFLRAATEVTWVENPDRVIKAIDGDYQPPGPGLPDSHMYPAWYNGHGIDLGKLHAGFFPSVKPGWLYACGEFGAEGLEDAGLMRRHYPASWLPQPGEPASSWHPSRIGKAQTGSHYAMFFDAQDSLEAWVAASQRHQAWATRLMTRALRRDARLVSFAIHLFIDSFPAGWMKTIIDFERRPKAAFFEYRDALKPLLADLKLQRWHWFGGETLQAEAWVCNDTHDVHPGSRLHYQLEVAGRVHFAQAAPAALQPDTPSAQGRLRLKLPTVASRTPATLRLALIAADGTLLDDTAESLTLFPHLPATPRATKTTSRAKVIGRRDGPAARLAAEFPLPAGRKVYLIDDLAAFEKQRTTVLTAVARGATALFVELPPGEFALPGGTVRIEQAHMEQRIFVSRATGHPWVAGLEPEDFRLWEQSELQRPAPVLQHLCYTPEAAENEDAWRPVLTTVQFGWGIKPVPALACTERAHGEGRLVISQVLLEGRLHNPVARLFASRLMLAN
jgi:hypothetical protein